MAEQDVISVPACLSEIEMRLSRAAAIARAGLVCAQAGEDREALRIVLDIEQLTGEATLLLGIAAIAGRRRRSE
jgi:hypothetical protein